MMLLQIKRQRTGSAVRHRLYRFTHRDASDTWGWCRWRPNGNLHPRVRR